MSKVMGIVLIFFACLLFAHQKAEGFGQMLQHLINMQQALIYMKNEISFSSKALADVTASLESILPEDMGCFFRRLSSYLSCHETADFGQAWAHAKAGWGEKPFLSPAADRILTDFSHQAGKLPKEAELAHFEKTISDLELELINARECYPQKRKLIYTLGICIATAVLILFL